MLRTRWIVAGFAVALVLTGCAADPATTPSSSPTAACPEPVHGTAPEGCAPFDPDAAMAENERYRDRLPLSEAQLADSVDPLAAATAALEPFALPDAAVSESAVITALGDAGFPPSTIQTLAAERADGTSVAFGISAEFGGCIFGGVSVRGLEIDAGGYILDGGCLPAVGH